MSDALFGAACKRPDVAAAIKREISAKSSDTKLPYPETIHLPFNRHALPDGLVLHPTPQSPSDAPGTWIFLHGSTVLMQEAGERLFLPEGPYPDWLDLHHYQPLFFASLEGHPVRAVQLPSDQPIPSDLVAEPFNAFQERIPADLMTIAGLGKQILHWQKMSRFCSRCGGKPVQLPESWGKQCPDCGMEHFPHIHPCAIVVIRRDNQVLLIHKPEWPLGRYSLVAGFLDMGESLEECAIREAMEETGVSIKNLHYVTSQAWPFPSQMMVGFVAEYASGDIKVDGKEIDDARWFTVGSLPSLPASRSIARFLIDTFAS
jgi:NAD+ diphosphatase